MLRIEGLRVAYGAVEVLHEVSFDVPPGRIVGVLGANGAGKSTLLRTISRLVPARSGRIWFRDHDLLHMAAHQIPRLGIAHVPEGRHVFPNLSVRDNLLLGDYVGRSRSRGGREAQLEAVFAMFPRLYERREQLAGSLSGGEQQMLVLGRALMLQPELLMLDEPSLGLAPIVVEEVFQRLATIHRELGVSILLVEQNAVQAMELIEYAVLLENGRVTFHGPKEAMAQSTFLQEAYLGIREM
jgi:branched-chain amino acid transport system ATP-binding protein